MLDMGFADELEAILEATPRDRQTVLFSATMPARITSIARKHLTDPVRIAELRTGDRARRAVTGVPFRQRRAVVYWYWM